MIKKIYPTLSLVVIFLSLSSCKSSILPHFLPLPKPVAVQIQEKKIDYLNSHGTGTVHNDLIETMIIKKYFGDINQQPLINSTKGLLGHTIGASGAIEAAVTALSISSGILHGNITNNPVENLNLIKTPIEKEINKAVSVSYGFGGHNAGLLLGKYDE